VALRRRRATKQGRRSPPRLNRTTVGDHGERGLRRVLPRVRPAHSRLFRLSQGCRAEPVTFTPTWFDGWPLRRLRSRPRFCICASGPCLLSNVDMALGDYLRAMMTVHARLDPDDRDNYRDALIDAFAQTSHLSS